jgi:predicted PurR-regulated permease PerM
MPNDDNSLKNRKYLSISLYAILVILVGAIIVKAITDWNSVLELFKHIISILSPFLLGFLFAFLMSPLVRWVDLNIFKKMFRVRKAKTSYYCSLALTYTFVIGLITALLIFVVPQIYYSLVDLTNTITKQYFVVVDKLEQMPDTWHDMNVNTLIESVTNAVQNLIPQLVSYITGITSNLIPFLFNTSLTLINGIVNTFLAIIISIYMLADKDNLMKNVSRFFYAVIPAGGSSIFLKTTRESINIFSRYLSGKTVDSIIIGLITFIVMSIFNLKFKLLVSVLVAITNMIPYFGPFIGGGIGAFILLIENPWDALVFIIIIFIIQQFDGIYLGPKIIGNSTGLKPLWVIFGITVGGSLMGVIGMLIGVPMVAVLSYILNIIIEYRLEKRDLNYVDGKLHSINKKAK